jgi:hypothetical protein
MGMRSIVDTIKSIDENSKKIVFKHFDQNNVNVLQNKVPFLGERLSTIAENVDKLNNLADENYSENEESLDSGN